MGLPQTTHRATSNLRPKRRKEVQIFNDFFVLYPPKLWATLKPLFKKLDRIWTKVVEEEHLSGDVGRKAFCERCIKAGIPSELFASGRLSPQLFLLTTEVDGSLNNRLSENVLTLLPTVWPGFEFHIPELATISRIDAVILDDSGLLIYGAYRSSKKPRRKGEQLRLPKSLHFMATWDKVDPSNFPI